MPVQNPCYLVCQILSNPLSPSKQASYVHPPRVRPPACDERERDRVTAFCAAQMKEGRMRGLEPIFPNWNYSCRWLQYRIYPVLTTNTWECHTIFTARATTVLTSSAKRLLPGLVNTISLLLAHTSLWHLVIWICRFTTNNMSSLTSCTIVKFN